MDGVQGGYVAGPRPQHQTYLLPVESTPTDIVQNRSGSAGKRMNKEIYSVRERIDEQTQVTDERTT